MPTNNLLMALTQQTSKQIPLTFTADTATITLTVFSSVTPSAENQTYIWYPRTSSIQLVGTNITNWSVDTIVSSLPAGLRLNSSTGQITGYPKVDVGTYTITLEGWNNLSTATAVFTLTIIVDVVKEDYLITLNDQTVVWDEDTTLVQLEGTNVETWTATNLPAGLRLNSSTGQITGTPSVADGTYKFIVTGQNIYYTKSVTVTVVVRIVMDALTLLASEASTVKLIQNGSPNVSGLQYRRTSTDTWSTYSIGNTITLPAGEYVQFKNTNSSLSTSATDTVQFVMTGKITASGDVQSMLNYSSTVPAFGLCTLFYECSSLVNVENLQLTATSVGDQGYALMFGNCTDFPTAPVLSFTSYCYRSLWFMFSGCSSLNYIKVAFTSWFENGLPAWMSNTSSTGTFVKPTALSEQYGIDQIPTGWTVENF